MSDETLDEIEAEILEGDVEFEGDGSNGADQIDADLAPAIAGTFLVVSNLICARVGVALVSEAEASAVGQAAAQVASFYDLRADPKTMAYVALAGALIGVAAPRVMELSQKRKEIEPEEEGGAINKTMTPDDFPKPYEGETFGG